jgi:hypothetical protein
MQNPQKALAGYGLLLYYTQALISVQQAKSSAAGTVATPRRRHCDAARYKR